MRIAREIEGRPLVGITLGLVLGIACILSSLNVVFLGVVALAPLSWRWRLAVLTAACVGALSMYLNRMPLLSEPFEFDGVADVVSQPARGEFGSRCIVRADGLRWYVAIPSSLQIAMGDTVSLRGRVDPPSEVLRKFAPGRGVCGQMRSPTRVRVVSRGAAIWHMGAMARDSFLGFAESSLDPRVGAVVRALCFSDDADVDHDLMRAMRRSGTIHIVSTSGLHVVLLTGALMLALSSLPVARAVQLAALGALLLVYAAACGFQAPVVRASIMAIVVAIAYLFHREGDGVSALCLAAILYLVAQPWCIQDIGFQLSFTVVAGLILFAWPISEKEAAGTAVWGRGLKTALVGTSIATAAGLPLVAYHFGVVSLTSVPANLLIAPLVVLVTVPALLAWLTFGVAASVAVGVMQVIVQPFSGWIMAVVDFFGSPTWAAVDIPEFSGYWLALIYGASLIMWRPYVRRA
jgi:ComEC/Rec2-related protein